ncbi:MAG: hypothetical protein K8J31_05900, partial [Anaerolineae bacterium]|nr:hypothetical protein [Anaerolineae bacterium]
ANDIPDYAPSWRCDTTRVLFTSDISGNPDIFDADALPIREPGIAVDLQAEQLTHDEADDIYPLGAPVEENASREGQFPAVGLGEQTVFLNPDASITPVDLSRESASVDWEPIDSCSIAGAFSLESGGTLALLQVGSLWPEHRAGVGGLSQPLSFTQGGMGGVHQ